MRRWNRWLLPALTGLVLLAAMLLPPKLSSLRDAPLWGRVHTEVLTAENGLSALAPTLPERIALLARWRAGEETLVSARQEFGTQGGVEALAREELTALMELGVLPPEVLPGEVWPLQEGRVVLRDAVTGVSASFLLAETARWTTDVWKQSSDFWLVLDEESGRILWLDIGDARLGKLWPSPETAGRGFLERLDLTAASVETKPGLAQFAFSEMEAGFVATVDDWLLGVRPVNRTETLLRENESSTK